MMGVSGSSAADQARLRCNKFEVGLIAIPTRLADGEFAFLDFRETNIGLNRCRSGRVVMDGWLRGDPSLVDKMAAAWILQGALDRLGWT